MPWIDRPGIERRAHLLHRLQQLRQTLEREELALQRHQDRIGGGHRVDGEKIERRRTVDQHIGVIGVRRDVGVQRGDRVAQPECAAGRRSQFELEARQIHGRRRDMQPRHRGRHHRFAQGRLADQHVIGRAVAVAAIDAEAGGGVALRIEIDDQHALADRRERGAEIDRGGGLADAALLVGQRQDARMAGQSRRLILLINLINYGHARVPWALADGSRRSMRSSSTIQPCPPVRLECNCGLIFQYLVASVNSASTSWPLRNKAFAPCFTSGSAKPMSWCSGATARAVTQSTGPRFYPHYPRCRPDEPCRAIG